MLVLTGLYLSIEAPFASYLVDVVGGQASQQVIDGAEQAGRLISGLAVALFLCGFILKSSLANTGKAADPEKTAGAVMKALFVSALAVGVMYHGERSFIDGIAERSSPQFRAEAIDASLAREALFRPDGGFAGIRVSAEERSSPVWLAFVGLFPFLSHADSTLLDRSIPGRLSLARQSVLKNFPSEHDFRSYGPYHEAMQKVEDAFLRIRPTRFGYGFDQAGYDAFVVRPDVQDRLHRELGISSGTWLTPKIDAASFRRLFYEPALARRVRDLADLERNPRLVADGGLFAEQGRSAVRALVVPVVALSLSLLGLFVHVVKFANFLLVCVLRGRTRWAKACEGVLCNGALRWAAISMAVVAAVAVMHKPAAAITGSPLYETMTAPLERSFGSRAVLAATVVIELERQAHPFGRMVGEAGPFRLVKGLFTPAEKGVRTAELGAPGST